MPDISLPPKADEIYFSSDINEKKLKAARCNLFNKVLYNLS
jgi:hypothetical protein